MNDSKQNFEERALRWQFWFTAVLSLFLIVTFALYLPLRFQHQAGGPLGPEAGAMHGTAGHEARYHEEAEVHEGLAVNLNVTPVPVTVGSTTRLDFFVNEKPGRIPVPVSALELEHTKRMHVIGVREDMNEFFHVHPQPTTTPGVLDIEYAFGKPGRYKIWSEIKKNGTNHAFGHPEIVVSGEGERSRGEVFFGRSAIVGGYQVLLHYDEPVARGRPTELHFEIHDAVGREAALEPYLAADMHLTIIRDDWRQFIHTHPAGHALREPAGGIAFIPAARANGAHPEPGGGAHGVPFSVPFPESGTYKLFAQFRPQGIGLPPDEALMVSFWIEVEERAPAAIPSTAILTAISLVLIAFLSWVTYRCITVKS